MPGLNNIHALLLLHQIFLAANQVDAEQGHRSSLLQQYLAVDAKEGSVRLGSRGREAEQRSESVHW